MPLRTDRGKKAALRNFWTWPLRSGKHLAVALGGAAVLITGVAVAADAISGPQAPRTNVGNGISTSATPYPSWSPTTSGTATTASTSGTSAAASVVPSSTSPAGASDNVALAVSAAKNFMTRWVRPPAGTSPEAWSRNLAPFVLPEVLVELRSINPDNIPATTVTGEPKVVENTGSAIAVEVPTDAAVINVVVVKLPDGRWLVRKWLPVS